MKPAQQGTEAGEDEGWLQCNLCGKWRDGFSAEYRAAFKVLSIGPWMIKEWFSQRISYICRRFYFE